MRFSRNTALILSTVAALFLAGCGGGGGSGPGGDPDKVAGKLGLIDISVADFNGVALNEIIKLEFSEELQPDSIRPDTIQIREGPNFGKQVFGEFRIDGTDVFFYPALPLVDQFGDPGEVLYVGLKPATTYQITIPGAPKVAVVRSFVDDPLKKSYEERFQTADANSATLFIDNFLDPLPAEVRFSNPVNGAVEVPADTDIVLNFNRRPLDPSTVTETNIRLIMVERFGAPLVRSIPGKPILDQSFDRVIITFQPTFPLADAAKYRLIAERLEDLIGSDVEYYEINFEVRDEPFRYEELRLEFDATDEAWKDDDMTTASWNGAVSGALAALFTAAGGSGLSEDLTPAPGENLQIRADLSSLKGVETVFEDGIWYDVINYRRINIPSNTTVAFVQRNGGPNRSLKVLALFPIQIDGTITVSGGNGEHGETSYSSSRLPLSRGGASGPGGADGADCYTGTKTNDAPNQDGDDVPNGPTGGQGGNEGTYNSNSKVSLGGGGGGGGSNEDGVKGKGGGYQWVATYNGSGGVGGKGAGGNLERLPNHGGAGGGAGGLGYYIYSTWTNYRTSAAGGGGGGGAITLQSGADINIGVDGTIAAMGGVGGNVRAYIYYGGGGGGGGGGSVRFATTSSVNFSNGATVDVSGGAGGIYAYTGNSSYAGSQGGRGGYGFVCIAVSDRNDVNGENSANFTYTPVYIDDTFAPSGGGAPSAGQTQWINLGVFGPELIEHIPGADIDEQKLNDSIMYEIQMCVEDQVNLGSPDLSALDINDGNGDGSIEDSTDLSIMSQWTPLTQMHNLNGENYQFVRVRVTFQLDGGQEFTDALPIVRRVSIHFRY